MSNALKYLLQGFQSSYNRAAQGYEQEQQSQNVLNREIALQNYKDRLKQQQEQQDFLKTQTNVGRLLRGEIPSEQLGTIPKSDFDIFKDISEFQTKQQDISREQKSRAIVNKFIAGQQLTPEEKQQITEKGYRQIEAQKKAFESPKPETLNLGMPIINQKLNRILQERGHEIKKEDVKNYPQTKKIGDKYYAITDTRSLGQAHKTINISGTKKKDWTEGTKILYKNYFDQQQKYQLALETGYYGKDPINEDNRKNYEEAVTEWNKKYVKHVYDNMPEIAKTWYDNYLKNNKNITPSEDNYWNSLLDAYHNGKFSKDKKNELLSIRYLTEMYRALYSKEPKDVNPSNFTESDTNDATDNESNNENDEF